MRRNSLEMEEMNARVALGERARIVAGAGGLAKLAIRSPLAEADVYLQGGTVTHFQPRGDEEVLYLSPASQFKRDAPIRGGIPICFPWFGLKRGEAEAPLHGYARLLPWDVIDLAEDGVGVITATLRCEVVEGQAIAGGWRVEQPCRLTLLVEVSSRLRVSLRIENTGGQPMRCEVALHSYIAVSDARRVQILGVEEATYIDKADDFERKRQPSAPVTFAAETDRVYINSEADCRILDVPGGRHVLVEKRGSQSTVIWNPWVQKTAGLDDLPDGDWPRFVCVETANVMDDALSLEPGAEHVIGTALSTYAVT